MLLTRPLRQIAILLFLSAICAHGEETQYRYSFEVLGGHNSYLKMQSMLEFEDFIVADYTELGIPAKVVQSFPAAPSFRMRFLMHFQKQSVGLAYSRSGTGGRINYADYSGNVTADYILFNSNYRFVVRTLNLGRPNFRVFQATQVGVKKSILRLNESIQIWDEKESGTFTVESLSYCIEPGIEVEKPIWGGVSLGLYAGADFIVFAAPFHLPGNKDAKMSLGDRELITPDWIEFQVAIKLIVVSFN